MSSKWTHYRAFEVIGEDNESPITSPVATEAEAVALAQESGVKYFLIYPCREVTSGSGSAWWKHASSYSYASF